MSAAAIVSTRGVLTSAQPTVELRLTRGLAGSLVRMRIVEITNPSRQDLALMVSVATENSNARAIDIGVVTPYPPDGTASYVFGFPEQAEQLLRTSSATLRATVDGIPAGTAVRADVGLLVELSLTQR